MPSITTPARFVAPSDPIGHTLALAGGAAMIAHGFVSRFTHDVDLRRSMRSKDSTPQDWAEDGIDANIVDDLRSIFAGWHRTLATTESD